MNILYKNNSKFFFILWKICLVFLILFCTANNSFSQSEEKKYVVFHSLDYADCGYLEEYPEYVDHETGFLLKGTLIAVKDGDYYYEFDNSSIFIETLDILYGDPLCCYEEIPKDMVPDFSQSEEKNTWCFIL